MIPRKGPFQQVLVLNGSSVADATVIPGGQSLSLVGLTDTLKLSDITSTARTAYAAGTKSKRTVTPGSTILDSTQYSITVKRPNTSPTNGFGEAVGFTKKTYTVFSGIGDSATTFLNRVRAEIAADLQAFVTATGTTTLILEMNDTNSDFTIDLTDFVASSTQAVTTAYVEPTGTYAIVSALDSANASSTAQYTMYQIEALRTIRDDNGNFVRNKYRYIIFADELATNYATFNKKLVSILTSLAGKPGFAPTSIAAGTYNVSNTDNFVFIRSGTTSTINLPDSAGYGDGMLIIVNNGSGTATVGKQTAGDTLIGTSATAITTVHAGVYVNCASETTWARIDVS